MTLRDYTANVISASKVVPDGAFQDSAASGVWDINEALDLIKGSNWPTTGNINPAAFVDNLFQTHLYTGNNTSTAINNGINLSGKGGLVWTKNRDDTQTHFIHDTLRGATKLLSPNDTNGEETQANSLTSFNSNGFTVNNLYVNNNGDDYVSWTFRKQPKFFDVVTYSGQNTDLALSHNLGVAPGMVIVKRYDTNGYDWYVYHRSLNLIDNLVLNSNGDTGQNSLWTSTSPTSTTFNLKGNTGAINQSGGSYVAYLFAHNNDDGGFGEPGDQDIIKCGSYTGNGSNTGSNSVTLGFEPQLVMIKRKDSSGNWVVVDSMRGMEVNGTGNDAILQWNTNSNESSLAESVLEPTATGFKLRSAGGDFNGSGGTYIYMAIRRGGMQTPSTPSDVFAINTTGTNDSPNNNFTVGFDVDLSLNTQTNGNQRYLVTRLLGNGSFKANDTTAFSTHSSSFFDGPSGTLDLNTNFWGTASNVISWSWKRARGYFDVVAYTGNSVAGRTINHNLGVEPEMMWVKRRSDANNCTVYHKGIDTTAPGDYGIYLDDTAQRVDSVNFWNDTAPTSSVFTVGTASKTNANTATYVAYLFATVAGVSKVGSYTANGSAQNIDCGFTNGTKWVMIRRSSGTGNWFLIDTTRGLVAGNDTLLELNTTSNQDSGYDDIDPLDAGFTITAYGGTAPYLNINGETYIFYAIANDPS